MNQEGLKGFNESMRERVVGQRLALSLINAALVRAQTSPQRKMPLVTLLFAGGAGLGKSTTARAMAQVLFGNERAYKEIPDTERIDVEIIKASSEQPCVVLLRIASDIADGRKCAALTTFLKTLQSSRPFSAESERAVEFHKSIFIVSLNIDLPAELSSAQSNESKEPLCAWLQERCRGTFAQDFFQSFDAIIPFNHFSVAAKVRLAEIRISELAAQQAVLGRSLSADNSVAAFVGSRATDKWGTLDLKGALDEYVGKPMNEAVRQCEAAGKRVTQIKLSVVDSEIRIAVG